MQPIVNIILVHNASDTYSKKLPIVNLETVY